jgi:hypothetical protein
MFRQFAIDNMGGGGVLTKHLSSSVLSKTLNEVHLISLNEPGQFLNKYSAQIGLIGTTL